MSKARGFVKSGLVLIMGENVRPRRILRGLASGYRISVSPKEHLGYLIGTREPHLQRIIRKHVNPGNTVYDIGASIGYVSLSLSARVGPSGRVFAFEPLPQNLTRLRQGIAASRAENITVIDIAASDLSGKTILRCADNPSMASLVWHSENQSAKVYQVRTERIDDLVDRGIIPNPSFVKLDVEGAEGKVISGMQRTLAASLPVLFIECSELGRETTWKVLKALGYKCERATSGAPVNDFSEHKHADFLWLPPEKSVQNRSITG